MVEIKLKEELAKIESINADTDRFLLAVSGGKDSVTMAHLFAEYPLHFGIAHCNFQLRGLDADQDLLFVQDLARQLKVPFFSQAFDTEQFAAKEKLSIQEAARQLRYDWLAQIRVDHQYDWIVTAHHAEDQLETFLYNFTKGSGIRGLTGIPAKNGRIIRPLLSTLPAQLQHFYQKKGLQHREDASNATDKYARNLIRHQVSPVLQQINPQLNSTSIRTFNILKETTQLLDAFIEEWKKTHIHQNQEEWKIPIQAVLSSAAPASLLYEVLRFAHFNTAQIQRIIDNAKHQHLSGALFQTASHELLIDRTHFLLRPRTTLDKSEEIILTDYKQSNSILHLEYHQQHPSNIFKDNKQIQVDAANIQFPLKVRRWQAGDSFCPIGMSGKHKKVQDLLSDSKLSLFDKEKIWILENGNEDIIWVIGLRMDERFKIRAKTEAHYVLHYLL